MEKRSDRHIRDLVAHTAFKGLDANEIGCARISVLARAIAPSKGRIQMSKTNYLQAVISDLQRTAGPYRLATHGRSIHQQQTCGCLFDHLVGAGEQRGRHFEAKRLRGLEIDDHLDLGGEFRSADRRASRALQNLIDKRRGVAT